MMNFIHVSDTHLGASNFKLKKREDDFLNSFKQVVDYCIKEKPDFIIHSGDLFDKGKPGNKVLLFTVKQLIKLKEKDIPLLITPGSHDVSVDGTLLTILEKVGLLTNVSKPENYVKEKNHVLMKGEEAGGAVIYGLPGRRANIKEVYESIKPEPSDKFKIFMFHHITTNIKDTEFFADIPLSLLPKGMDYYAGGHWHEHESFSYQGKPVVYPGSTEYGDTRSMERHKPRGFIHYKDGEPEFIELKNRGVVVKRVDCNRLTPEEATNKCLNSFSKEGGDSLIVLKLEGVLSSGRRNMIDTSLIKKQAVSNDYLYCNVKLSGLKNPSEKIVSTNSKNINEIEQEHLRAKGYNESEVKLARRLINLLGNDYTPSELPKALEKAGELIDN